MENRRQNYRISFEPEQLLRAELYRPGQRAVLACDVLDLSLGGMRARLRELTGVLCVGDFLITRLLGRDDPAPIDLSLSIPSQVVSFEERGEERYFGLSFLPIADPHANDHIERTLSRFLLAEQRRKRQIQNRQRA